MSLGEPWWAQGVLVGVVRAGRAECCKVRFVSAIAAVEKKCGDTSRNADKNYSNGCTDWAFVTAALSPSSSTLQPSAQSGRGKAGQDVAEQDGVRQNRTE